MKMRNVLCLAGLLGVAVRPAPAQPARVSNANVRAHSASQGVQPVIEELTRRGEGPAWAGWLVPARKDARACCWSPDSSDNPGCCGGCRLAKRGADAHAGDANGTALAVGRQPVALDERADLLILLRLEAGSVEQVRFFSRDCPLDAGGAELHWLDDVKPADSVAALAALVPAARGALAAIAHHAGPAADVALEDLVQPGHPSKVRRDAAFWMGLARGSRGIETLLRLMSDDADQGFRKHLTFVLSQSKEVRALDALIAVARNDPARRVRAQALFWLAQKAGRREVATIGEALHSDPDIGIKKKAVFALSQLPADEGVPLLIKTARSHGNRVVRQQALFWLGQSDDQRALAYIEEVLTR